MDSPNMLICTLLVIGMGMFMLWATGEDGDE
jgi:hypothetical protein